MPIKCRDFIDVQLELLQEGVSDGCVCAGVYVYTCVYEPVYMRLQCLNKDGRILCSCQGDITYGYAGAVRAACFLVVTALHTGSDITVESPLSYLPGQAWH